MFQTHSMVPRRCFPNLMNISRSVSETRCISQSDQNKTWSWPSKVDILFSNKLIRLWCQPFYLVPEFKRSDWWKWRTPAPMKMTLYGPLIAISFNNFVTGVRACILPSLFVFSKKKYMRLSWEVEELSSRRLHSPAWINAGFSPRASRYTISSGRRFSGHGSDRRAQDTCAHWRTSSGLRRVRHVVD